MATMDIFTKTVGKEPVKVTVKPTDTIAELKEQLELKSMKVRLRSQTLQNDKSLEHYGVKADDLLCFFANNTTPKGFTSRAHYQAANRIERGKTQKSVAHTSLHQGTQEVVMQESALS